MSSRRLSTPHSLLLCAVVSICACREEVIGSPEVPGSIRQLDPGPADAPAPDVEPADAPDYVVVDLTEFGFAASLRAEGDVEARATPDGVRLESGAGFSLLIGRGSLDMTKEREELVRAYGPRFERFIKDEPNVVAWEVTSPTGSTYHFFASFEEALSYHCRTSPEGANSPQLIGVMIETCRGVRATDAQ